MGWLGTRLLKRSSQQVEEAEAPGPVTEPGPTGPPLVLLVPDIAGTGSFRAHVFNDAESAADFIESTLLPELRYGSLPFWGLHERPQDGPPGAEGRIEAMVLIRTAGESNQMYVVSFVDMESAQSFARFEVKRGLNLSLVSIYWACLVTVTAGSGGVQLAPASPPAGKTRTPAPAARAQQAIATPAPQPPERSDEAAPEEDPELHLIPNEPVDTDPEPHLIAGESAHADPELHLIAEESAHADPELHLIAEEPAHTDPEPHLIAAEPPDADPEPHLIAAEPPDADPELHLIAEESAHADPELHLIAAEPAHAGPEPSLIPEEPARELALSSAASLEPPSKPVEPAGNGNAARGVALPREEMDLLVRSFHGDEETLLAVPAIFALEPAMDTVAGDEEFAGEADQTLAAAGTAQPPAATPPQPPGDPEPEDATAEIEKILQVKRWKKKDDPFKGFGSPPGRF